MARDRLVDHALGEGALAEVAGEVVGGGGVPPAFGDELLEQRLAPRDADDHGAALGEGAGRDVADAGGRAGHDDDLAAIVGGHRGLQQAPRGYAVKPGRAVARAAPA